MADFGSNFDFGDSPFFKDEGVDVFAAQLGWVLRKPESPYTIEMLLTTKSGTIIATQTSEYAHTKFGGISFQYATGRASQQYQLRINQIGVSGQTLTGETISYSESFASGDLSLFSSPYNFQPTLVFDTNAWRVDAPSVDYKLYTPAVNLATEDIYFKPTITKFFPEALDRLVTNVAINIDVCYNGLATNDTSVGWKERNATTITLLDSYGHPAYSLLYTPNLDASTTTDVDLVLTTYPTFISYPLTLPRFDVRITHLLYWQDAIYIATENRLGAGVFKAYESSDGHLVSYGFPRAEIFPTRLEENTRITGFGAISNEKIYAGATDISLYNRYVWAEKSLLMVMKDLRPTNSYEQGDKVSASTVFDGKVWFGIERPAIRGGAVLFVYDPTEYSWNIIPNSEFSNNANDEAVDSMCVYQGQLFLGMRNSFNLTSVLIYNKRYWRRFLVTDIFNSDYSIQTSITSMVVFDDQLWVGSKSSIGIRARISYFDQLRWTDKSNETFLQHVEYVGCMIEYEDALYAGVGSDVSTDVGGHILKYSPIEVAWTKISNGEVFGCLVPDTNDPGICVTANADPLNNYMVNALLAHGGNVYAGSYNPISGAVIAVLRL